MTTSATAVRQAHPFVKWTGGKRQLLGEIQSRLPESYGSYYEPFVGGAVFFDPVSQRAAINDISSSLINAYWQIRDNPRDVMSVLDKLDNEEFSA